MKFMHMISLRGSVIKLIATFFCLMTLASCGGGGGAPGLPSGTPVTLSTSAPSTLSLVIGTAKQYTITGGRAPYTVSSSNPSVVATGVSDNNFSITAALTGTANVEIKDAAGTAVSVAVTVTDGSSTTALYTTAPSALTLVVGTAQTYTVSGGLAPYTVNSSNTFVSIAGISANTINIAAVSVGTAQIGIFDAAGKSISVSVTVSNGSSATPLFTTAPASVTISNGGTRTYTIGGGLAPYTATSSDTIIATTSVIGSTLSIEGVAGGTTSITVRDTANTIVSISVKVGSANTFFTTAPSALTILVGAAPTYTISGGSGIYAASSSNINIVQATVVGSSLTIAGVAAGTATVSVLDSTGASVLISVKVSTSGTGVDTALYTTAPGAITIPIASAAVPPPVYDIGGGTGPYFATSSIAGVATASVVGSKLTITGVAAGSTQIKVLDSTGTSVTIGVTVSTSATGVVTALYTTAAPSVTIAPTTSATYGIGGGTGPYVATTSNVAVVTASVSTAGLTITGVANGSAQVMVGDSTGSSITINVIVSEGAVTALYTTAPSTITLTKGNTAYYTIGGGRSPYTATTSNAGVATTSVLGTNLSIVGGSLDGLAQIKVVDATGTSVTISVTVGSGTSTALFTSAPSPVTISIAASSTYAIGGGTAPYTVNSGNASVATASGSGTSFTITGVAAGSTSVTIRDSVGGVVTVAVTVSPTASAPLAVLPSNPTGSVGDVLNFSISGGSPSYTVTVNNPSIASVTPTTVATSGGTFMATLSNVGSTIVAIVDSQGQTTTFTLTVTASVATLRLSPSALQVGENSLSPIVLNIYGGTGPYSAYTSDLVVSTVPTVPITGTILTVAVGSTTHNRCITAVPFGTYNVTITVVDKLGASATSVVTIQDNGGAACL